MGSLQYSKNGLSVLTKFHRKKHIFYVEGQDDKLFWEIILNYFGFEEYKIKEAGCREELKKYAKKVINLESNVYILFDCDYSDLLNNQYRHDNIIYTYGYSIENSLYSEKNISQAIAIYTRTKVENQKFDSWLNNFLAELKELLILDIANEIYNKGVSILGDNSCKFLKKNDSIHLDKEFIKNYLNSKKKIFNKKNIQEVKVIVKKSQKELKYIFRGHFLSNIVINYIRSQVKSTNKKFSISKENLFAQFIAQYSNSIHKSKDIKYLERKFIKLAS